MKIELLVVKDEGFKETIRMRLRDLPGNHKAFVLDGSTMETISHALEEFARVFLFPVTFGRNFNALEDSLTDLEWLPAEMYILIVKNAQLLLSKEEPDDFTALLGLLDRVVDFWREPIRVNQPWDRDGKGFEVWFHVSPEGTQTMLAKLPASRISRP